VRVQVPYRLFVPLGLRVVRSDLPAFFLSPMIPAPPDFEDLREYLLRRDVDYAWIRTVLLQYLQEYDHQQTDLDMDLDHQVWQYREIIGQFVLLISENTDEDDQDDGD
jgi:hypothetical protein